MCSLCVIFVLMVCATSTCQIIFESHNGCGCFHQEKCPESYKVKCSSELTDLEAFYSQNSWSSTNPKICGNIPLEGFIKNITVSENGTLTTKLQFSSDFRPLDFFLTVELFHQNQSSSFVHSRKYLQLEQITETMCKKVIEVSFTYVFSGYYQLNVSNFKKEGCVSKPFNVISLYKKAHLTEKKPKVSTSYMAQSQVLKYTYVNDEIYQPKSIYVSLHEKFGQKCRIMSEAHLTHMHKGNCCHAITHKSDPPMNMSYCLCKWDDNSTLLCNFREITNGNYCIILKYIDTRCEKNTLWTKPRNCVWTLIKEVKGSVTPLPYEINSSDDRSLFAQIILWAAGSITVLCMISCLLIIRWRRHKQDFYIPKLEYSHTEQTSYEEKEILFLYPRDCEAFMRVMTHIRMILKDSCFLKVYDPWEEEMFDEIAESLETWSLPLIKNDNVKIIIVLSECSKMIEEAYVDRTCHIVYKNPKLLDNVFGQSMSFINQYFATRSDSYQRVFIVRLDEPPVINLSFHLNCTTVYTIPHVLKTLMDDLADGYSKEMNQELITKLKEAIKEYLCFKECHRNYLNEILAVSKQNKKLDEVV